MASGLLLDDCFKEHLTGPGHPEAPARLDAVRKALEQTGLPARMAAIPVRGASDDDVLRVHDAAYLERIARACAEGAEYIDSPDSTIGPHSYDVARSAAGSVVGAVDGVMDGWCGNAFCAVRPPGHHAERDRSMGFCLLNNIAIAADHLIRERGIERVMILDWDVHHCNGTQHTFESRSDVLVVSVHGHPHWLFPGTGFEHETGVGAGVGFTLNVPMAPGAGDGDYRRAFAERIRPVSERFAPEFLLLSAGFDAHRRDPLAPLELDTSSFGWMTRWALDLAARHCDGRVVSLLEGGYDLEALAECVALHVKLMCGV